MSYVNQIIAGIDESGRGPLFGPVVACAVIFDKEIDISKIADSKKLSALKRQKIYNQLIKERIDYGVGVVHEEEIDRINILNATKKAMLLAVKNLKKTPSKLLIDGNQLLNTKINQEAIVKGDQKIPQISAASIIAKVKRDNIINSYSQIYPMFDLFRHKGYGTKRHIQLLNQYGPTKNHRKSFKPISKISKRKLIKYESLSIIQYAIYLIKNGYDIYLITTTSFMIVKHKIRKLNIYTVSINRYTGLSMIDKILFEIKQKDSVNNGRLDVIYDDDSINFIPQYSCKVV